MRGLRWAIRPSGRQLFLTVIASIGLAAFVAGCGVVPPPKPAGPSAPAPYTGPSITGPENVTFLYHTLPEATAAGQLANIGHPRDLVYGSTNDAVVPGRADEPAYAHQIGARAFKYTQFTWFPAVGDTWLGTTAAQRASWTLCTSGATPLTDAGDGDGAQHGAFAWSYADANERAYVDGVLAWTAQLKAMGYDGVFIDVGGRSTRGPGWSSRSTCTSDPVTRGAKSSDAWFNLLMQVKAQGLKVAVNMGSTTEDPLTRPNPANPAAVKTDVRQFDWILHEDGAHPKENYPAESPAIQAQLRTFESTVARNKNDSLFGKGQVVEMAKARLPVTDPNRIRQEEYVWTLAKLSGAPVALNAGFDFCGAPAGTTDCNRTGLSPALTDLRLGAPIDHAAYPAACDARGCMYVRRFQNGLVVVSAYGTPRRIATIPLGTATCKRITAFQGGQQAKGLCTRSLGVETSATRWSHIYAYTA